MFNVCNFPLILRVIANYIALRVFVNNLQYMNFSVRKNMKLFIKEPTENKEGYIMEFDRWKFCVSYIADNMQYPLGLMYVSSMWPENAANEVYYLHFNNKKYFENI